MVIPHGPETRLLPFLEYHIDDTKSADIEEIASIANTGVFKPLILDELPREEGFMWLRFTLAPRQMHLHAETYLLDMGQSIPGQPCLFIPSTNELSGAMEWRESSPAQRNILLMPEQGNTPLTCYIKVNGLPGPWFDPVIRSPHNAATNWSSLFHTGSTLALGVVMLLCLLRGLNENGQWRFWTGLFTGFALLEAILGLPTYEGGFSIQRIDAIMTPGLAIMTLPHAGRHLLHTKEYSRSLDYQLIFFSLLGGCCALAPLIPGLSWLDRWLELWPLVLAAMIPSALAIWMTGIPGGAGFLLAVLIPPIFTAFAWYGRDFGFSPNMLSSMPAWGIAFSALILVALPAGRTNKPQDKKKEKETPQLKITSPDNDIIMLEHPLNDPNLRIAHNNPENITPEHHSPPSQNTSFLSFPKALQTREASMREELDALLRETANLGQCALPPATRVYAERILSTANSIAQIITNPEYRSEEEVHEDVLEKFNLPSLIRMVHDQAAPIAEHAGLALSWYMPPFLPQEYWGNSQYLSHTLSLLVDSAIRGTTRGHIKISTRRVPESPDPGHLLFTISDTGTGAPPLNRSSVALAKAWELASRYNGFLGMESGPGGLSISFSVHLATESSEKDLKRKIQVMLVGSEGGTRSKLATLIEEIPYGVTELQSIAEAVEKQDVTPVSLLVASDSEARPAAGDLIEKFVKKGLKAGFSVIHILAVTEDDSQWRLLKTSGFTHAMLEPVEDEAFKYTVSNLVEESVRTGFQPQTENDPSEESGHADRTSPEATSDLLNMMDSFYSRTSTIIRDTQEENFAQDDTPSAEADHAGAEVPQEETESEYGPPFEGPDWLMYRKKTSGLNTTTVSRTSKPADESVHQADGQEAASNNSAGNESGESPQIPHKEHAPEVEPIILDEIWISEPSPVGTADNKAGKSENSSLPVNADPAIASHYDNSPSQLENESSRQSNGQAASTGSVMDFIVSVNPAENDPSDHHLDGETSPPSPDKKIFMQKEMGLTTDPVILNTLDEIDRKLNSAQLAYKGRNCLDVEEITAAMAVQAENFGFRIVGRLARCVERAARARDLPALGDLLPVLSDAIERNRIASAPETPVKD